MNSLAEKVPEEVIVRTFAQYLAISPAKYQSVLERLAARYEVPCDEAFTKYVAEVLDKQPALDFD